MRTHSGMAVRRQGARGMVGLLVGWIVWGIGGMAWAIDIKLSPEEAKKALEAGRTPMEKANSPEDVKKVLQQASMVTRVGADPEKDQCGASAILRTKRYRLEAFGRTGSGRIEKAEEGSAHARRVHPEGHGHAEHGDRSATLRR